MELDIKEELEKLENMLNNGEMLDTRANNFMIDYEHEDYYSRSCIIQMQNSFAERARAYLKKYYPGTYVLKIDWCVHIMDKSFYADKGLRNGVMC